MNHCKHLIVFILFIANCGLNKTLAQGRRSFTVKDSIEMTTFSDPYTRLANAECQRSPDKKYFLLITTRGHLAENKLESTLSIYSAPEVDAYLHNKNARPPQAQELFRRIGTPIADQSISYGSLITMAQWSSDSHSILSLVEQPNGDRHLFRSYLLGRRSADLTPGKANVANFSEARGTIAYLTAQTMAPPKMIGTPIGDSSSDLTGLSLFHVFFPEWFPDPSSFYPTYNLWVRYRGMNRKVNSNGTWYFPVSAAGFRIAVSPNGRALIAAKPVSNVPSAWSQYKIADSTLGLDQAHTGSDRSGRSFNWPWQYVYVDLDKMTIAPLVDAPTGFLEGYIDTRQAIWSSDSQSVLFTNSYLPLPNRVNMQTSEEVGACAAAVYLVATKATSCIAYARFPKENESLRSLSFGASQDEVTLHWSGESKNQIDVYKNSPKGWVLEGHDAAIAQTEPTLKLCLKQDINIAPTLWATESKSGLAKQLWDPNPQLLSIELGQASVYTWKDKSGYEWHGGLVLPPDYTRGHRYPLVIQTHGFYNKHEFLVDGSFTTGFAARALAGAGLIVLQVEDRADRHTQSAQDEALLAVNGFKAAVNQLDRDGLIERSRVGIIGFSRTAWYAEEALVREPHLFRAATLIDGVDQSYMTYMLFAPGNSRAALEGEAANGAKPFGHGLDLWLKNAATFNLDKIQTPVRIEALGSISLLGEWEIYSSLYLQGKPVDLVYIPHRQHILQSPRSRYASQQGNVNWFRFWLQGDSQYSSGTTAQSDRWKSLASETNAFDSKDAMRP